MLKNKIRQVLVILLIITLFKTVLQAVLWQIFGNFLTFSFPKKIVFSASMTYIFDLPATLMFLFLFYIFLRLFKKIFKINLFTMVLISILTCLLLAYFWNLREIEVLINANQYSFAEIWNKQKRGGFRLLIMIISIFTFSILYYHSIYKSDIIRD
jgi:hypothetical protein